MDDNNPMHRLRRWAEVNSHHIGEALVPEHELQQLVQDIQHALRVLDSVWEAAAGRKLTPEEKGIDNDLTFSTVSDIEK